MTRLSLYGVTLNSVPVSKILGVWISEDMIWERNTMEICKKAYSRLSKITKLKYAGVCTEDLLDIYIKKSVLLQSDGNINKNAYVP